MSARRRWGTAALMLALILIVATFPMRLALAWSGATDAGVTAREVRGSVWSGELVEARLGALPLGTVRASLSPLALLGGDTVLAFSRTDERLGALAGRLHGSNPRGVSDVNGTTSMSGGLGMIPVDTIRFEGATLRFDGGGKCARASGRIQLAVSAPIAGLDLSRGLSGTLTCANGRAQAALASQSGMERLTLSFDGSGAYRAQFAINVDRDPAMAAALAMLGFKAGSGGFVLATTGRFDVTILDALPFGMGVAFAALIGLVLGSFIATLVLRWPAGRSVFGRSQCDGCGRTLGVADLVPLLSAMVARGCCRRCRAAIDPFHWRVELGSMLIGGIALAAMPGTAGWMWALFGWMLLPLALLDARHFWLPDRLSALLAVTGLVLAGPIMGAPLVDRWLGALVGGGALALIAWAYRRARGGEGMGGGDHKLVAAIGCWLGWQALPLMLLLASLGGIVWALAAQRKGDQPLAQRRIPFGVFACTAAFATVPLWPLLSGL